jgi:Domain of unknown function (DUF5666)
MKTPTPATGINRRTVLLALAGSALQLAGCGGGVDVAGLSSGGTGSFTSGTIIGLGSIIVNGIRYDIDQARIIGESSSPDSLKLGMVVSIQGSSTQASSTPGGPLTATAAQIRYGSEWRGPLGTIDTDSGSFTLLGQTGDVLAATVFDGATDLAGLAGLTSPALIEVYGYLDPSTGRLQATRVEVKAALKDYRLSGVVIQQDSGSFTLGTTTTTTTISYSAATPQPASWGPGSLVHVRLTSALTALEITTSAQQLLGELRLDDDDEAELEGIVTAYQAGSTRFAVNGIDIDGSKIADLAGLGLAPGMRIEVEGRIAGGLIMASQIGVKGSSSALKDSRMEYEFHGTLSQLTDTSFLLRGYTISYHPSILEDGLALQDGQKVEVKAVKSGDGLQAVEIQAAD